MGLRKLFIFGPLLMIFLISCAGFAYKYYPLDVDSGTLIGDKPEHDLPVVKCKGPDEKPHLCIVMFTDEFERMRAHQIEIEKRLEACENPH